MEIQWKGTKSQKREVNNRYYLEVRAKARTLLNPVSPEKESTKHDWTSRGINLTISLTRKKLRHFKLPPYHLFPILPPEKYRKIAKTGDLNRALGSKTAFCFVLISAISVPQNLKEHKFFSLSHL